MGLSHLSHLSHFAMRGAILTALAVVTMPFSMLSIFAILSLITTIRFLNKNFLERRREKNNKLTKITNIIFNAHPTIGIRPSKNPPISARRATFITIIPSGEKSDIDLGFVSCSAIETYH